MFTHQYRGWFIHGCFGTDTAFVEDTNYNQFGPFKSYRAAQLFIARKTHEQN